MWVQFLITLLIVTFAGYIIYKNLKGISAGDCGCGNCGAKQKKQSLLEKLIKSIQ